MITISRGDKEKFIADLSEDDFREKLVRRLFRSLGYGDGRDTCGPEEYGKDAIFVETDKFGVHNFTAIQTKKGNINLSGDPSANLHSLIAQVRTALDHPHVCTLSKKKVLPLTVYVIASGKINQGARNYIAEKVDDPRVRFLDRDDLISKIDDQCPELWGGVIADISPYLKALANRVEDLTLTLDSNPVHSPIGTFVAASDGRFVDVKLGYHEPSLAKSGGRISESFEYQEISGTQLLTGKSVRVLLLGDAGSGKTTLLIRLAYLIAKKSISSTKNYQVPIFARAHELVGRADVSHFAALQEIVGKIQDLPTTPFTIDDFEEGRIVLMVDGLDELSEAGDRQEVLDFLASFGEMFPKNSIALTTRPYTSITKLSGLERYRRYRISPLSMDDASKMLKGLDGRGRDGDASWRKEILRKLDGMHGIELNPLLVTVFAVSADGEKRDIPANITELFAKFTELMLGRWDEKKGLSQQYQAKVKDHLLSTFAFQLQAAGDSRFLKSDFVEFARVKLEEMNLSADLDTVISEVVDRSGLLRGEDELEFKHHLLQEYFAARGIPNLAFVKQVIDQDWWRNSVVFYFGGKPDAVHELMEVATDAGTGARENYLTVGLALQACYLSRLDDRIEVWKWVVEGAAAAAYSELQNPDKAYPITAFVSRYLEGRDAVALSGMEKASTGAETWVVAGNHTDIPELRRFWYAAALIELAEFEKLEAFLKANPFETDLLATAIHFGCFFAASVRSLPNKSKERAEDICRALDSRVQLLRVQITKEFRGQLLEYRNGGVVALDLDEPEQNST